MNEKEIIEFYFLKDSSNTYFFFKKSSKDFEYWKNNCEKLLKVMDKDQLNKLSKSTFLKMKEILKLEISSEIKMDNIKIKSFKGKEYELFKFEILSEENVILKTTYLIKNKTEIIYTASF